MNNGNGNGNDNNNHNYSINNKRELLSISELARFARTTRAALIHYDKIGALRPAVVGKNNYRYYSYDQIGLVNLIRTMQSFGMPLKKISEITQKRSPRDMLNLLNNQLVYINKNILEQLEIRKLVLTLQNTIEEAVAINDENEIKVHWMEKKAIFLGPKNDYSDGKSDYDALLKFYRFCKKKDAGINLNYSVWGYFSKERIEQGDWVYPDRYYFNAPDGYDEKPAGLYVTGYARGSYGYPHTDALYRRLMAHIRENNLEIDGGSYEEYPLNEISIKNPDEYLIRISIRVKTKDT